MMWPILEPELVKHLSAELGVRVGTKIPADVDVLAGFVRVSRGPGSDDGLTDSPLVDVEAFAPSEIGAARLAEQARSVFHALKGGRRLAGILVDSVSTATGPTALQYSPTICRYVASYRLSYRPNF